MKQNPDFNYCFTQLEVIFKLPISKQYLSRYKVSFISFKSFRKYWFYIVLNLACLVCVLRIVQVKYSKGKLTPFLLFDRLVLAEIQLFVNYLPFAILSKLLLNLSTYSKNMIAIYVVFY